MKSSLGVQIDLHDFLPEIDTFREDVLCGLSRSPKELSCKYFYDRRGSRLFDRICELEEYYPTRTEMAIMRRHGVEMAALLGPHCRLVEYGSGSSLKTRILLDHMDRPAAYVPLDISREHLKESAAALSTAYPALPVTPVCADYNADFELPPAPLDALRTAVYFPGSTIGNFHPEQALRFLHHVAHVCGPGGALLIGVDLKKDIAILEPAYNDREGVTAEFNLNLLRRINFELGADFDLDGFGHYAYYNQLQGRIEMHLISRKTQTVHVPSPAGPNGAVPIHFRANESIHTENSYKYSLPEFARLADMASFDIERTWVDENDLFSVQYLIRH